MAVKNLHLEHLEDEIINNGIDGGRASINFLRSLRDMMKGTSKKGVNMTVNTRQSIEKWPRQISIKNLGEICIRVCCP